MFNRGRIRPTKGASLMGMIVGIIFVGIGVTTVLPTAGGFGVIWTLVALAIAVSHGYNFFTGKGGSGWEVDLEHTGTMEPQKPDFETKLRKLKNLREDNIITEEEYQKKKQEIMNQDW